jgi:Glyoxalase-like domain
MGIGRLQCHVIDVNDLAVAEAFWSELTGLAVIPSVFPGRHSYLGRADPWRHGVILHLVRTEKGPEANRSHVDIWVREVDRAIEQVEAIGGRLKRRPPGHLTRAGHRGSSSASRSRPGPGGGEPGPRRGRRCWGGR